ncbi:DUF6281 family protein [Nocardioides sp. R1-1]|uniref:DUF6281 family protein n=1 Tax=Nocardioides sp. R1-1 TaxID=3383502 RepID=UPI0038D1A31C
MSLAPAARVLGLVLCATGVAGCSGQGDAEGDCSQELVFREETYLGYGSADGETADADLGAGELGGCPDGEGSATGGEDAVPVRVHSIHGHAPEDVVGVEVEGRLDLYLREGMSTEDIDRLIEELT